MNKIGGGNEGHAHTNEGCKSNDANDNASQETSFMEEKVERPCQSTVILGKADNRGHHLLRFRQPPIKGAQVIAQASCDNNVRESGQRKPRGQQWLFGM